MNRQITIQKFICFALGIVMVIAGAYFADVQAETVGRLGQSPALVSLMSPELARSTQDTAEGRPVFARLVSPWKRQDVICKGTALQYA
ncbi:MAG: hypothetical protein ACLR5B_03200 [Blautia sp.]